MHRPTSHLVHFTHRALSFFGHKKNVDGNTVGLMILLASVCYGYFCWGLLLLLLFFFFFLLKIVFNITSLSTWSWVGVSNQNFTDGFLLKFYFFPGHRSIPTIICLVSTTTYNRAQLQKRDTSEIRMSFAVDSKTDLKLQRDYCIKFQLFEGAQDVTRLTTVCCTLLPHNPYRLPQHYNRHICGPLVAVNIEFYGYLQILSISFAWIICVQYSTDNLSGQQSLLHRPVVILQPAVSTGGRDKQS